MNGRSDQSIQHLSACLIITSDTYAHPLNTLSIIAVTTNYCYTVGLRHLFKERSDFKLDGTDFMLKTRLKWTFTRSIHLQQCHLSQWMLNVNSASCFRHRMLGSSPAACLIQEKISVSVKTTNTVHLAKSYDFSVKLKDDTFIWTVQNKAHNIYAKITVSLKSPFLFFTF